MNRNIGDAQMFDAYHQLLGIPKDQRPPTFYELLGIGSMTTEDDVIERAAFRQSRRLADFRDGEHAELCERLLQEIALAKATLLNPEKRKAYDEKLAKRARQIGLRSETAIAPGTPRAQRNIGDASSRRLETNEEPLAPGKTVRRRTPEAATFPSWVLPTAVAGGLMGMVLLVGTLALVVSHIEVLPQHADPPIEIAQQPHLEKPADPPGVAPPEVVPPMVAPGQPPMPAPPPPTKPTTPPEPNPIPIPDPKPKPLVEPILEPPVPLERRGSSDVIAVNVQSSRIFALPEPDQFVLVSSNLYFLDLKKKPCIPIAIPIPKADDGSNLVYRLELFPDKKRFAFLGHLESTQISIFDIDERRLVGAIPTTKQLRGFGISGDGKWFAAWRDAGGLQVWNLSTKRLHCSFDSPRMFDPSILFHPDNKRIILPKTDGIHVVDIEAKTFKKLESFKDNSIDAALSLDGNTVYHVSAGELRVADLLAEKSWSIDLEHEARFLRISVSKKQLGVLDRSFTKATVFQLPEVRPLCQIELEPAGTKFSDLAFSSDDRYAVLTRRRNNNETILHRVDLGPRPVVAAELPKKMEPKIDPKMVEAAKVDPMPLPKNPIEEPIEQVEVPSEEKIKELQSIIRERYKVRYEATRKSMKERIDLAEELRKLAIETKEDADGRYVLLCEARDLAIRGAKTSLVLATLNDLAQFFKIDVPEVRRSAFALLVKTPIVGESARELSLTILADAKEFAHDELFDKAIEMADIAVTAAKKANHAVTIATAQAFEKDVKAWSKEHARAATSQKILNEKADDIEANFDVGRYLFARKGEDEAGLAHLAKAGMRPVAELARRDLGLRAVNEPNDVRSMDTIARDWLAFGEKDASWKMASRGRALFWFKQAEPIAEGLALNLIKDKIAVLAGTGPAVAERVVTKKTSAGLVRTLKANVGGVFCLQLAMEGKRLVSGGADGMAHILEASNLRQIQAVTVGAPILSANLSSDGKWLAVCTNIAPTFRLYNLKFDPPKRMHSAESVPGACFISPSAVLYLERGTLTTFDTETSAIGLGADYRDIARLFSNENGSVVCGLGSLGVHHAWDVAIDRPTFRSRLLVDNPIVAAISSNGKVSAFTTRDKLTFGGVDGNASQYLVINGSTMRAAAFDSTGTKLALVGNEKVLRVFEMPTGKELMRFTGHAAPINAVVLNSDVTMAFTGSNDGTVRQWRLTKN